MGQWIKISAPNLEELHSITETHITDKKNTSINNSMTPTNVPRQVPL